MKDLYRKIKKFIQRGRRGWSDEDTWGLCDYLSQVISESTKQLNKDISSYPPGLSEKKWEKILNKISKDIMAVKELDDKFYDLSGEDPELIVYRKEMKKAYKKQTKALELLVKYWNNLWD